MEIKTHDDFLEKILIPYVYKLDSIEEYNKLSSKNYIKDIQIPTLFIHSKDDPLCVPEMIPISEIIFNKYCMLILTNHGGHVEFF